MSSRIRVSMVSYLNSKPFILGLEMLGLLNEIELTLEIPVKSAEKLKNKEVEVALMPIAVLPQIKNAHLITDYCIGANGAVNSVFLYSQVPICQIETIYLDAHSRTSANLLQILCREHWQIEPEFVENTNVTKDLIQGSSACLMIGDKAIPLINTFNHQYDLAFEWQQLTSLPFVFAGWVATKPYPELEKKLNQAFQLGLQHIDKIAPLYQEQYPYFDVEAYLKQNIDFHYNTEKARALDLFLQKIKENRTYLSI